MTDQPRFVRLVGTRGQPSIDNGAVFAWALSEYHARDMSMEDRLRHIRKWAMLWHIPVRVREGRRLGSLLAMNEDIASRQGPKWTVVMAWCALQPEEDPWWPRERTFWFRRQTMYQVTKTHFDCYLGTISMGHRWWKDGLVLNDDELWPDAPRHPIALEPMEKP